MSKTPNLALNTNMQISAIKGRLEEQKNVLFVLHIFSDALDLKGVEKSLDNFLGKSISSAIKEDRFTGELGETLFVHQNGSRALVVGLGKKKDFDKLSMRNASAVIHKFAKKIGVRRIVSSLASFQLNKFTLSECARALVEGALLGAYEFNKYKMSPKTKPHEVLNWDIVCEDGSQIKSVENGIELGTVVSDGVVMARDLVNEPAREMNPHALAQIAIQIAKDSRGKIKTRVYSKPEIEKMKMGGLLGVNQGSVSEPLFVHMKYKCASAKKRICIVGKAITFDAGGLSLKTPQMMETMKCDMAGAAAVLGVFSILTKLSPKINIDGIFAATENMPSGSAIRPGDILRAMNGKTMEIISTDAEGRLTLADALSYASKLKPDAIIDLATLTGSCMLALGEEIGGIMSNNERLVEKLVKCAECAGEKLCALPLHKGYKKSIESKVADIKNCGGKYGGVITAGLFLQEFVGESIPWAHIDIAGPAFVEQDLNSYTSYGGTGAGVATVIEFLHGV